MQQQIYDMLMKSQFWTRSQLVDFQHEQLKQLLRHAQTNVPFYKNRLAPVIGRNGIFNWDHWENVPILTRNDLVEHRDAMQAIHLPKGHGEAQDKWSSGTSGVPVTVTWNGLAQDAAEAANLRANLWHNVDWSKPACDHTPAGIGKALYPDGHLDGIWGPLWEVSGGCGPAWSLNSATPPSDVCRFLAAKEIAYLACRPQHAFAAALEAKNLRLDVKLDAILCHGAAVTDEMREVCLEAFGAKMIALYSSTECHKMAHPCPDGDCYHVNDELLLLEIVDHNGIACPPGTIGRVVVTPFFSTAQPLIRYDHGDLAIAGKRCQCGRSLSILDNIIGRTSQMLLRADGKRINVFIPPAFRLPIGTLALQIAQTGKASFEVRYEETSAPHPGGQADLTGNLKQQLGESITVKYVKLDAPLLTAEGKFLETVLEWKNRDA
jgi:phenylacetate-CoA ligase